MPRRNRNTLEYAEAVQGYREQGFDNYDARQLAAIANDPCDIVTRDDGSPGCPKCGAEVKECGGMVGETMLLCTNDDCDWSWTDEVGALRSVL